MIRITIEQINSDTDRYTKYGAVFDDTTDLEQATAMVETTLRRIQEGEQ